MFPLDQHQTLNLEVKANGAGGEGGGSKGVDEGLDSLARREEGVVVVRIFFLRPGGGKVEEEGVLKGYGQEGGERELKRRLKLLKEKGVIRGSSKVVVGWRFEGEQGKDGVSSE